MRGAMTFLLWGLLTLLAAQPGQTFPPPEVVPPNEATKTVIQASIEKLERAIDRLQRLGVHDPALADIEIYERAARMVVQHEEYYKQTAQQIVPVLEQGLLRASQQARGETPWLMLTGQTVPRGYRSRLDDTVQPYAVTYPHDYGEGKRQRYRVEVVLHGRDPSLTEVGFLFRHGNGKLAPKDLSYVRIDVFGRGNNAYRWAGEVDVIEAVENFFTVEAYLGRGMLVDRSRVVLRGYSMGGAGTWHIGLHRPDQWIALGPGAGFTTTRGYVKGFPEKLPDHQEACLRIYDAVNYAENAFHVPIVAYNGEDDPQIQAARNIEARLKELGLSMTHYVAPKRKHEQPPPEFEAKMQEEFARYAARGRGGYPRKVKFVTYTLKYPTCHWVELLALDRHYEQARVEAEQLDDGYQLKTENVKTLRIALAPGATREPTSITIDGEQLSVLPQATGGNQLFVCLTRQGKSWQPLLVERFLVDQLRQPRKVHGQQGPIDDAFMAPFLCVRGTGIPWNAAVQEFAQRRLEQFQTEWSKFFRGDLPIKNDTDVTSEDLALRHLIVFGDPGSNSLLAQALPRLPLTWTKNEITFAGVKYKAGQHLPVLIYPSPLSASRYIVLNSGHTFGAREFQGSNALLYPRLGDYAILKLPTSRTEVEIRTAGLFDDNWMPRK